MKDTKYWQREVGKITKAKKTTEGQILSKIRKKTDSMTEAERIEFTGVLALVLEQGVSDIDIAISHVVDIIGKPAVMSEFDESKVKRDKGQFSNKQVAGAGDKVKVEGKGKIKPKEKGLVDKFKAKVGKLADKMSKPLLKAGYSEKTSRSIALVAAGLLIAPNFPGMSFALSGGLYGGALIGKIAANKIDDAIDWINELDDKDQAGAVMSEKPAGKDIMKKIHAVTKNLNEKSQNRFIYTCMALLDKGDRDVDVIISKAKRVMQKIQSQANMGENQ